jgi:hypothetical protein
LREKHDLLEKHVAEQSKKTENPTDKARMKTAGPKRSADASGKLPATGKI